MSKFALPDPAAITFAAHSYQTGFGTMTCVPVTVSLLKGGSGSVTRYTLKQSLGASWTDSYPTVYGAVNTSNCLQVYSAGPASVSIHSGAGRGVNSPALSSCDITDGSIAYAYGPIFTPTTTAPSGTTSIWFR